MAPDWALTRTLSETDRALSQLAGVGRTIPNPHLLIGPFVRREYDLLIAVSEEGAWNAWVSFFLTGIQEQAQDAILRAQRLQDLQEDWHARLTEVRTSVLLLHAMSTSWSMRVY
jgi:hypothetical protein